MQLCMLQETDAVLKQHVMEAYIVGADRVIGFLFRNANCAMLLVTLCSRDMWARDRRSSKKECCNSGLKRV